MNSPSHFKLLKKLRTIQAPSGSLVLWDNRIPHQTCQHLSGCDTREVIYTSFLTDCILNRKYIAKQAECILHNISPPAYQMNKIKERNWEIKDLTQHQKNLLGL